MRRRKIIAVAGWLAVVSFLHAFPANPLLLEIGRASQ